jgi:hypothetical protein
MIAVEEKKNDAGVDAFGKQIEQMIRDPLSGANEAITGLLEKVGTMGTGLAVGVGVLTAITAAGREAAKNLSEYGTRIGDAELRTGLQGVTSIFRKAEMVPIVGATGLVGNEVCQRLTRMGERVRALVRTTSSRQNIETLRSSGAELCIGDLKK